MLDLVLFARWCWWRWWRQDQLKTLLGAQLFLARVAYAVVYVAGIPWLHRVWFMSCRPGDDLPAACVG
jgi:hypothetical protein